jgi:hypothetical protein
VPKYTRVRASHFHGNNDPWGFAEPWIIELAYRLDLLLDRLPERESVEMGQKEPKPLAAPPPPVVPSSRLSTPVATPQRPPSPPQPQHKETK